MPFDQLWCINPRHADGGEEAEDSLECDYERNCTPLFKSIERCAWNDAAIFLGTGFWPYSLLPDGASPSEQARTWVTQMEPNQCVKDSSGQISKYCRIVWSKLPLHLAIELDAPLNVISRLVNLYPDSVRCSNSENMLPLHLALISGSSNSVVSFLLEANPRALKVKCNHGMTALDCAMESSNLTGVRNLIKMVACLAKRTEEDGPINEVDSLLLVIERELELTHFRSLIEMNLEITERGLQETRIDLDAMEKELNEARSKDQTATIGKTEDGESPEDSVEFMQASKIELEEVESRMRKYEIALRADLKAIEVCIAQSLGNALAQNNDVCPLVQAEVIKERCVQELHDHIKAEVKLLEENIRQKSETSTKYLYMWKRLEDVAIVLSKAKPIESLMGMKTDVTSLKRDMRGKIVGNSIFCHEIQRYDGADNQIWHHEMHDRLLFRKTKKFLKGIWRRSRHHRCQTADIISEIRSDLSEIQAWVTELLRWYKGKQRIDLEKIKNALHQFSVTQLDEAELVEIKAKFNAVKEKLRQLEAADMMSRELRSLGRDLSTISTRVRSLSVKNDLDEMRQILKQMCKSSLEGLSYDFLLTMAAQIRGLKIVPIETEGNQTKEKLANILKILQNDIANTVSDDSFADIMHSFIPDSTKNCQCTGLSNCSGQKSQFRKRENCPKELGIFANNAPHKIDLIESECTKLLSTSPVQHKAALYHQQFAAERSIFFRLMREKRTRHSKSAISSVRPLYSVGKLGKRGMEALENDLNLSAALSQSSSSLSASSNDSTMIRTLFPAGGLAHDFEDLDYSETSESDTVEVESKAQPT